MEEEWRPCVGFEGIYEVSNLGKVRSLRSGRILKPQRSHNGKYLVITTFQCDKWGTALVHNLVAEAFIDEYNKDTVVIHKDDDPTNCSVDNLKLILRSERLKYTGSISDKSKISKKVKCIETGIVYDSIASCGRELGVCSRSVNRCVNGEQKALNNGLHFEYVEEENGGLTKMGYYNKFIKLPVENIGTEHILMLIEAIREEDDLKMRKKICEKTIEALDILYDDPNDLFTRYQKICIDMLISLIMCCSDKLKKKDRIVICTDATNWFYRFRKTIKED